MRWSPQEMELVSLLRDPQRVLLPLRFRLKSKPRLRFLLFADKNIEINRLAL